MKEALKITWQFGNKDLPNFVYCSGKIRLSLIKRIQEAEVPVRYTKNSKENLAYFFDFSGRVSYLTKTRVKSPEFLDTIYVNVSVKRYYSTTT